MSKALYPITHYYIDSGDLDSNYNLRIFMDDDIYKEFKKELSEMPIIAVIDRFVYDMYGLPINGWEFYSSEQINNRKEWILYCGHVVNKKQNCGYLKCKKMYVHNRYIELIKE